MENCSKEILENYSNQTTQSLQQIASQINTITNQNQLNNIWNKIHKALTKAATKHIPFKKIQTIKEAYDTSTTKQLPLFYRYKQIQYLKNHPLSSNFLTLLHNYQTEYPDNSISTNSSLSDQIKNEFQLIKTVLNYQQKQATYKEIQQKIENWNKVFNETPKLFYKNILEKYNNINIDRLLLNNILLTDQNKILNTVHYHFSNYFKEKLLQPILPSSEFFQLYQLYSELETYYQNLFDDISDQEWNEIITNLPNQKAAGPSEICYEHIKYASHKAQKSLKLFINKCFQLQKVPTEWKSSNIFLIPKKSN